jgi:hypothetical protein
MLARSNGTSFPLSLKSNSRANSASTGGGSRRVTNTFNFSVMPRYEPRGGTVKEVAG